MSDTVYNVGKYFRYSPKEFVAMLITGFFAGFILTFNDWGTEEFSMSTGILNWAMMAVFLIFIMFCAVALSKLIGIRFGYMVEYEYHLPGLLIGAFICIFSAGWLPIFIPGGFNIKHHERMRLGKFMSHYKHWELGVIAAMFPIGILLFVLLLNPIYLATEIEFYATLLVAVCVTALYSMIPLPNFIQGSSGNLKDWWNYLKGCTFGLEVYYSSGFWYMVLTLTILVFCLMTWAITELGGTVGILVYGLALILTFVGIWVYRKFLR